MTMILEGPDQSDGRGLTWAAWPPDDAGYWRNRAKKMRSLAEAMHDPVAKSVILGIADDYEEIPKLVEDRADDAARARVSAPTAQVKRTGRRAGLKSRTGTRTRTPRATRSEIRFATFSRQAGFRPCALTPSARCRSLAKSSGDEQPQGAVPMNRRKGEITSRQVTIVDHV
jgi:hypothetical protein